MISLQHLSYRTVLSLCLAGVLAGCASAPSPTLLTLPAGVTFAKSGAAARTDERVASPTLVVNRLNLPEYLVSRRVRYQDQGSILGEWPNTYWAERIEIAASREFLAALDQELPDWNLCENNCSDRSPAATLQVNILRLDYERSKRRLRADVTSTLWINDGKSRSIVSKKRNFDIAGEGDSAQSQALAMTELLRQTADWAADSLRTTISDAGMSAPSNLVGSMPSHRRIVSSHPSQPIATGRPETNP